jgi:membrane protein DedA with SNARE-associated domain
MVFETFSVASNFVLHNSYILIFLMMVIEGPMVTAAAAFAASLGYFNIYLIFFMSLMGDLVGDCLHYIIGYFSRIGVIEKYGQKIGLKADFLKRMETKLQNNLGKAMFIIKFTPITTPGLLTAGALKVPIRSYVFYSLIITLPRTIFFVSIGYYFGVGFEKIANYFEWGQYLFFGILVLILIIYLVFRM